MPLGRTLLAAVLLAIPTLRLVLGEDARGSPAAEPVYEGATATTWAAKLEAPEIAVRRKAAYALYQLGAASAPAAASLGKGLGDADSYVRDTCFSTLRRLDAAGAPAVPHAAALLASQDDAVRRGAANFLYGAKSLSSAAVPQLVEALDSDDEVVRGLAAGALGHAGAAAKVAVDSLRAHLDDGVPEVATQAARALAAVDVDALIAAYRGVGTEPVRLAIVRALAELPQPPDAASAVALDALSSPTLASFAASIFRSLGSRARGSVPSLLEWLAAEDEHARMNAVVVLGYVGGGDPRVAPALLRVLESDSGRARIFAAASLGRLKLDAASAVPALVARLSPATQADVRREAATALLRIGRPLADSSIPVLQHLVDEERDAAPVIVVYVLACLSAERRAPGIARVVADALGDDPVRRNSAQWTLLDAGPDSPPEVVDPIVSSLIVELDSKSAPRRARAVRAMAALGPLAKAALPALGRLANDPDPDVQRELLFTYTIRR